MTYAAQPLGGFQMWDCECGRIRLAMGLGICPSCGKPRPASKAAQDPAPPVPPAARRTRTRTRKGG